jgi:Zn-dependent M28 family amino/carboxypeptidase
MNGKRFLAAVFAAIVATVAAAQVQPKVTAADLKADVSFLASDALEGRGTPSKGLDIAAEYIAAEFRRAGLEPAGDDGYFQNAPYASITPNLDGLELTLETGDRVVKAESASMGLQEAAAADLSHGPAVRATMKDAAALDALTPDQVRGKVLLLVIPPDAQYSVTRGIPNAVIRLEPALVLSVRTHGQGLSTGPRLRDTSAPGAKAPILAVWDAAIQAAVAAAEEIKVSAHIPAPAAAPVKLRNVIGVLRGSDPVLRDTYLVLTAHYDHLGVRGSGDGDHIYNGANDDASGTSSVVEIAKALAALPQRPRRSIVFITLFGEELGELGSRYYCQHPVFPLAKTVADINLEQLGRTDDTEGPRLLQFNLTGFDYTDIAAFVSKAGEETGIRVVKHEKNSDSFFGRSDNAAFADAGVPSTTLSVSYIFPDYHRPGDEWPKLDYDNMAKVDGAVGLGVYRIADSAEAPQWNKANPKTARYVEAREKQ